MSALALNGGEAELARWGGLPHWPRVREGDEEALLGVLRSGNWGSTAGDQVARFQQEFAAYEGADEGIALVNGTLAIVAALRACRVGLGDEVIVPRTPLSRQLRHRCWLGPFRSSRMWIPTVT